MQKAVSLEDLKKAHQKLQDEFPCTKLGCNEKCDGPDCDYYHYYDWFKKAVEFGEMLQAYRLHVQQNAKTFEEIVELRKITDGIHNSFIFAKWVSLGVVVGGEQKETAT